MDIKSIMFYTVIILLLSSAFGKAIKVVPKLLRGIFKLLVTLTFMTTIFKNFIFLKSLFPGIREVAENIRFSNALGKVIFYFNEYIKTIFYLIINYFN